jgi:hypothetical protein
MREVCEFIRIKYVKYDFETDRFAQKSIEYYLCKGLFMAKITLKKLGRNILANKL